MRFHTDGVAVPPTCGKSTLKLDHPLGEAIMVAAIAPLLRQQTFRQQRCSRDYQQPQYDAAEIVIAQVVETAHADQRSRQDRGHTFQTEQPEDFTEPLRMERYQQRQRQQLHAEDIRLHHAAYDGLARMAE